MNFNTFLALVENKKNKEGYDEFIDSHIKNKYVPLEEKQARANVIVENTFYEKDEDGIKRFHINSVAHNMFVYLTLVDLYTDIEIDYKRGLEIYNKMKEKKIFKDILQRIDKEEMEEFKIVLDAVERDVMTNEYEPHAYFASQVERFGKLIGFVIEPFLDKLNAQDIVGLVEKLNLK